MQEYVSNVLMLGKSPLRDQDGRYTFFAERFGKVSGKATSSRKITSKLAPHLEPGTLSRVRFVEKGGTQIVDALKFDRVGLTPNDLYFLNQLLPDTEPETELWQLFANKNFSWAAALRILGWDPESAECAVCAKTAISHFYLARQEFFCTTCASKLEKNKVLLVYAEVQPKFHLGEQAERISI